MTEVSTTPDANPTVALVHGAFAESASWNGVIDKLFAHGYQVVAIPNPLRGVSGDAEYVASALAGIQGPVVLVGHSYGGSVITNAVRGNSNVRALVYVAGFAPEPGESTADLAGKFPGSTLSETLYPVALLGGSRDLYIRQEKFWAQFAADLPQADAMRLAATQRPATEAALLTNDATSVPAWKTLPSWFVYGELDKNIPAASHAFMAKRAGAQESVEVAGASHVVMISHPQRVADSILSAIAAVNSHNVG